jgi:hypothetical protein
MEFEDGFKYFHAVCSGKAKKSPQKATDWRGIKKDYLLKQT